MIRYRSFLSVNRLSQRGRKLSGQTVPYNLVFSSVTESSLTLSWNPPPGPVPDSYVVQRKLSSEDITGWTQIATPTDPTINDSLLDANTSYDYRAAAVISAVQGAWSQVGTQLTARSAVVILGFDAGMDAFMDAAMDGGLAA